jgi:arsenate reductase
MKSKVLFLCTGNSCRSQMAEGWLRELGGDRFEALSAGTRPTAVNPLAIEAMLEKGIDISKQRSKSLDEFVSAKLDLVVTVCDNANAECPIFPGEVVTRMHWPFDDPAGATGTHDERMQVFRRVRDEIEARLREFVAAR